MVINSSSHPSSLPGADLVNAGPPVVGRLNFGKKMTTLMRSWVWLQARKGPPRQLVGAGEQQEIQDRGSLFPQLTLRACEQNKAKPGMKFPNSFQLLPSLDLFSESQRGSFIPHSFQGQGLMTLGSWNPP